MWKWDFIFRTAAETFVLNRYRVKAKLFEMMQTDKDFTQEDEERLNPTHQVPSIFNNVLRTAFALVDPKSVKNTVRSSVSFYAFGIYERKSCT